MTDNNTRDAVRAMLEASQGRAISKEASDSLARFNITDDELEAILARVTAGAWEAETIDASSAPALQAALERAHAAAPKYFYDEDEV